MKNIRREIVERSKALKPRLGRGVGWVMHARWWRGVLVLLGMVAASMLIWRGWIHEIEQPITCGRPPTTEGGYVQLELLEQHPIEPGYKTRLRLYSLDPSDAGKRTVRVHMPGARGYGPTSQVIRLRTERHPDGRFATSGSAELNVIPTEGMHQEFPFDSASFNLVMDIEPPLGARALHITDRLPGFYLRCEGDGMQFSEGGGLVASFRLERSLFVRAASVMLCGGALLLAFLILQIRERAELAVTSASFFFSLWSIRNIFATQLKAFPVLLDFAILGIGAVFMLGLVVRIALPSRWKR